MPQNPGKDTPSAFSVISEDPVLQVSSPGDVEQAGELERGSPRSLPSPTDTTTEDQDMNQAPDSWSHSNTNTSTAMIPANQSEDEDEEMPSLEDVSDEVTPTGNAPIRDSPHTLFPLFSGLAFIENGNEHEHEGMSNGNGFVDYGVDHDLMDEDESEEESDDDLSLASGIFGVIPISQLLGGMNNDSAPELMPFLPSYPSHLYYAPNELPFDNPNLIPPNGQPPTSYNSFLPSTGPVVPPASIPVLASPPFPAQDQGAGSPAGTAHSPNAHGSLSPQHGMSTSVYNQTGTLSINGHTPSLGATIVDTVHTLPTGQEVHPFQGLFDLLDNLERPRRRSRFDAIAFVDSLPEISASDIPVTDNKCPHCWLPFGTTYEDDPEYVPDEPESEEQAVLAELPFDVNKPNNDPVKTLCGHIFGRSCLIESLERCGRRCPMCRTKFNAPVPGPAVLYG